MKVSKNEMVKIRVHLLEQMDEYAHAHIDESHLINIWYTYGIKKNPEHSEFIRCAKDDRLWNGCVIAFRTCCNLQGILK